MIVSDASSCGIKLDCHPDDSRGIIYDRNVHRGVFILPLWISYNIGIDQGYNIVSVERGSTRHKGMLMVGHKTKSDTKNFVCGLPSTYDTKCHYAKYYYIIVS
jgi:hypothetical protein